MSLGTLSIIGRIGGNNDLGTSLTTISSTTKITDLATILPNNFNALNAGKIETSTTTLPLLTTAVNLVSVGALASGSLTTGFTAVPVALGGTGTTSPSLYSLMIGNGALGLTTASSTGTSGQFLTSGGAGAYPTWTTSSIDETLSYNFIGTSFLVKNLSASSTVANPLILNGLSLNTPSSLPSASSTLIMDSSGNLTFGAPQATSTIFTSSGTWVKPDGVTTVKVTVVGGGGGGGDCGSTSGDGGAGGGGAGGYAEAVVVVSGNVTVTVGAAGAASGNGGNSSFAGDVTVTSNGGTGGTDDAGDGGGATGGAGGTTTNGDLGITGQAGSRAAVGTAYWMPSIGGSNPLGQGGQPANSESAVGVAATGYGGGGSGGADTTTVARVGGVGTQGVVIVEWFK